MCVRFCGLRSLRSAVDETKGNRRWIVSFALFLCVIAFLLSVVVMSVCVKYMCVYVCVCV
jgi:hypothetical protein